MNSYDLSRNWFNFCFENPEKIKPNHSAVYFFAIEHCNRLGWKEKFGFPTTMVMEAVGIKSYNTYINTLHDLVNWKFISYYHFFDEKFKMKIIDIESIPEELQFLTEQLQKGNKYLDQVLNQIGYVNIH